jgi:hypothetical protein
MPPLPTVRELHQTCLPPASTVHKMSTLTTISPAWHDVPSPVEHQTGVQVHCSGQWLTCFTKA